MLSVRGGRPGEAGRENTDRMRRRQVVAALTRRVRDDIRGDRFGFFMEGGRTGLGVRDDIGRGDRVDHFVDIPDGVDGGEALGGSDAARRAGDRPDEEGHGDGLVRARERSGVTL